MGFMLKKLVAEEPRQDLGLVPIQRLRTAETRAPEALRHRSPVTHILVQVCVVRRTWFNMFTK